MPMNDIASLPGPIPLHRFGEIKHISSTTLWRFRKRGWIRTVNLGGRPYILPSEAAEFERRAAAGEFAKAPHGVAAQVEKEVR